MSSGENLLHVFANQIWYSYLLTPLFFTSGNTYEVHDCKGRYDPHKVDIEVDIQLFG